MEAVAGHRLRGERRDPLRVREPSVDEPWSHVFTRVKIRPVLGS